MKTTTYIPQPIDTSAIELPRELMDLAEEMAKNVHEVWSAGRMADGWTYGSVRNDILKHHPDLIPYSALPDTEKEYDRLMAINTIKLLKKLGWKIAPK